MEFAILLAKGIASTVGIALAVIILGSLLFRNARSESRMALGTLGVTLGFIAGFLVLWGWPGYWPAEAWQMPLIAALATGILLTPATMMRSFARWPLILAAVAVVTALIVRTKLTPLSIFLPSLSGAMLIYLATLRPSVKNRRLWLTATAPLFLSTFAAVLAVMLYVDQNTGRMLILLCALSGTLIGSGAIPALRDAGRGGVEVTALLFAAVLAPGRLLQLRPPQLRLHPSRNRPARAAAGWIPALQKRPWTCALIAIITTLAIAAPALWRAVKNAPAFD